MALAVACTNVMAQKPAKYKGRTGEQWYKKDPVKYLERAADLGYHEALYDLGNNYLFGVNNVERDEKLGAAMLLKAAELGNADAQNDIGVCYYIGRGVEQDYTKAAQWVKKAADQGNTQGMSGLGECYYYGRGVEQDYNKAFDLFKKAEDCRAAQYFLSECYFYGHGVDQDFQKADEYRTSAIGQGYDRENNEKAFLRKMSRLAVDISAIGTLAQVELIHFANDFVEASDSDFKKIAGDRDMIAVWKILIKPTIGKDVRTNVALIEKIAKLRNTYPDVDFSHVERTLGSAATDKERAEMIGQIMEEGADIKGIDHFRALMGDYEHIEGVTKGPYVDNGCDYVDVKWTLTSTTWQPDWNFDLPAKRHVTFTGSAKQVKLTKGTKIYRVYGDDQNPAGSFWTYTPPATLAEFYGRTAVKPSWNNHKNMVEYTVGDIELPVWEGVIAAQSILDGLDTKEYFLAGGKIQLYIPDDARNKIMGGRTEMSKLAKPIDLK